jgi:hypothetical protein
MIAFLGDQGSLVINILIEVEKSFNFLSRIE